MARAAGDNMPMIIGGSTIYSQAMGLATVIHITEIDIEAVGDTFFPELEESEWSEAECRTGDDSRLTFRKLERRQSPA
jgi:dihydrofolate reductase